jgi:hypothetical protein
MKKRRWAYVMYWKISVSYFDSGNPPHVIQLASARRPHFVQIKAYWDGHNCNVPLHRKGDGGRGKHQVWGIEGPFQLPVVDALRGHGTRLGYVFERDKETKRRPL